MKAIHSDPVIRALNIQKAVWLKALTAFMKVIKNIIQMLKNCMIAHFLHKDLIYPKLLLAIKRSQMWPVRGY